MNVSGVSPRAGIYTYNSIRLNELRSQQIAASQEARNQKLLDEEVALQQQQDDARKEQTYTSYDFAQEYRAGEVYELKGEEADITRLDVAKAVSDMEKDQILHQYQYFVGDAAHTAKGNASEMSLRSGENFIL